MTQSLSNAVAESQLDYDPRELFLIHEAVSRALNESITVNPAAQEEVLDWDELKFDAYDIAPGVYEINVFGVRHDSPVIEDLIRDELRHDLGGERMNKLQFYISTAPV